MAVTWKGEDDPRLVLARRLYKETGDAETVAKAMRSLGYGAEESKAAAAHVAPKKASPAPDATPRGRGSSTRAGAGPRAGGSNQTPTPPRAPAPAPAGGGLGEFLTGGPKMPAPSLKLPRRPSSTQVVGFGFGIVLYAVVITYLRYGPEGVKGWLGAKLLNKPYIAPEGPVDGSGGQGFGNPAGSAGSDSTGSGPLTSTRHHHHHRRHHHAASTAT